MRGESLHLRPFAFALFCLYFPFSFLPVCLFLSVAFPVCLWKSLHVSWGESARARCFRVCVCVSLCEREGVIERVLFLKNPSLCLF